MRVQKYLSQKGILSRRKAEEYILAGKISVNGKILKELGRQIDPEKDKIKVLGGDTAAQFETIIIHKPRGVVSSRIKSEGKTIYELFPQYEHLHITGRLDKESEGLLLLTNDGVLARKITGSEHSVEKEYHVFTQENIFPAQLEKMAKGVRLTDGMTLPAETQKIGPHEFIIILKEGRNHQIRRMCDRVSLTVNRLIRTRIGSVELGDLRAGKSRFLKPQEVQRLKKIQK